MIEINIYIYIYIYVYIYIYINNLFFFKFHISVKYILLTHMVAAYNTTFKKSSCSYYYVHIQIYCRDLIYVINLSPSTQRLYVKIINRLRGNMAI